MGQENGASSLRPEPRGQRLESGAAGAEAGPGSPQEGDPELRPRGGLVCGPELPRRGGQGCFQAGGPGGSPTMPPGPPGQRAPL